VEIDCSRACFAEGWAVPGTEDGYAAEGCVDVELCQGTALSMLERLG
jgi:hypothetical protein